MRKYILCEEIYKYTEITFDHFILFSIYIQNQLK